jgi:hypothetical protein
MAEQDVINALMTRLAALTLSPAVPVVYENVKSANTVPRIEVQFSFGPAVSPEFGVKREQSGILQLTVVTATSVGIVQAHTIAASLLAHYPVILRLYSPQIRFTQPGFVRDGRVENDEYRLPVSIRYTATLEE